MGGMLASAESTEDAFYAPDCRSECDYVKYQVRTTFPHPWLHSEPSKCFVALFVLIPPLLNGDRAGRQILAKSSNTRAILAKNLNVTP